MPEVYQTRHISQSYLLTRPQIGEVGRIVHYIRKHLVNRTIKTCQAFEDEIVYGKVGTSAAAFSKALEGRKVTGADQQGKYFYVTFDKPPHAVMHFGMTGWLKLNVEDTGYYKQAKETAGKVEEWPPKYMKFLWKCDAEGDKEACEAAFVDARRLARIRLVDCEADKIRDASPLKENGPDPVRDKDILTVDWLSALTKRKRVPIKALLLDQANISGVGNWVADEILYQARIHPEQYSNEFSEAQVKALHHALVFVCTTAVETLADSTKFPDDWIMKYRWDKGKKDANVLPNGEKIVHITVGGRTSAVVPSRQKKTGAVAGDVKEDDVEEKPSKGKKRKSKADEDVDGEDEKPAAKKTGRRKK
jgi:formamidopyrimidine-DNA glycosylase